MNLSAICQILLHFQQKAAAFTIILSLSPSPSTLSSHWNKCIWCVNLTNSKHLSHSDSSYYFTVQILCFLCTKKAFRSFFPLLFFGGFVEDVQKWCNTNTRQCVWCDRDQIQIGPARKECCPSGNQVKVYHTFCYNSGLGFFLTKSRRCMFWCWSSNSSQVFIWWQLNVRNTAIIQIKQENGNVLRARVHNMHAHIATLAYRNCLICLSISPSSVWCHNKHKHLALMANLAAICLWRIQTRTIFSPMSGHAVVPKSQNGPIVWGELNAAVHLTLLIIRLEAWLTQSSWRVMSVSLGLWFVPIESVGAFWWNCSDACIHFVQWIISTICAH